MRGRNGFCIMGEPPEPPNMLPPPFMLAIIIAGKKFMSNMLRYSMVWKRGAMGLLVGATSEPVASVWAEARARHAASSITTYFIMMTV